MKIEHAPNQTTGLRQSLFAGDKMEQAFAILKMPLPQLKTYLYEEINQNPLLEEIHVQVEEPPQDDALHPLEFTEDDFSFVAPFASYLDVDEEHPTWEERIPQATTLSRHLLTQSEEEFSSKEERLAALYLIGSLEDDGTLITPLEEIASFSHIPLATFKKVLPIMQGFDPPGIFTSPVDFNDKTPIQPLIADLIQKGRAAYVDESDLPNFHFKMPNVAGLSSEDRTYIRERVKSGEWLLKNLEIRRDTLKKIGDAILFFQKPFFSEKQEPLLPLTYKDVAEKIGLHPSTVARAVQGKWFSTERGTFPLEAFFPEKVENSSSEALKEGLMRLVRDENKSHPFSDEDISKKLGCSRRVIAKYRSLLGIPTSHKRKAS